MIISILILILSPRENNQVRCPSIENKIDCLINKTIGFIDPKNIYQCYRSMICCIEYTKPSCCRSKPSIEIIKEQVTLWGGLFAILFCLASIVYCRKRDVRLPFCSPLKSCLIRICCGDQQRIAQRNQHPNRHHCLDHSYQRSRCDQDRTVSSYLNRDRIDTIVDQESKRINRDGRDGDFNLKHYGYGSNDLIGIETNQSSLSLNKSNRSQRETKKLWPANKMSQVKVKPIDIDD
ncbi:Calcium/calmodulin-dependent 3' 5'-cyclic nucleotide phosphodiesterase 1C [Sarcoptes scabiei]|nr:Calcium/calmodulin-dependent 3' 5'-cyclic nucleotide phosphodiesterase 1C [Sarcoptes scabiei]